VIDEVAQRLHEWLVGHPEVLAARPGQHNGVLPANLTGQLGRQTGLAHPRLPGQERDSQFSGRRFFPQLAEALQLAVPAHEDPQRAREQRRQ
jgi:hypothetical protein